MFVLEHLKKNIYFDLRSLALYRFFLGLIVVADVLYRWGDIENFYTDVGLIPRSLFLNEMTMPWSFSLHLANGSYWFAFLMFLIQLLFGLMLVFGYKTRWAIIGAFVMAVSVHNRNWLINNGGHDVLRAILFISIFLPMNKRFSIDSAFSNVRTEENRYFSTWVLVYYLQVFLIYYVSYILKDSDIWRKDYTAFFFSSRLDIFSTPIGTWLRQFPVFGKAITFVSIYLECLGPLFLFFPSSFGKNWWKVRFSLVVLFIVFHIGIFFTMNIGLFTFICEAMWLIFIPTEFWDYLTAKSIARGQDKISIYYDQDCHFCFKIVRVIREFFLLNKVQILPSLSREDIPSKMKKMNSWVILDKDENSFFKFSGFLQVLKNSPIFGFLYPICSFSFIRNSGEKIYELVANNRNNLSKVSQFLTFSEPKKELIYFKWLLEGCGCFIFITLFIWNLTTIKKINYSSPFFQNVARWLHLYQEWNMFAPYPKVDNIWIEVPAVLSDGSEIELISGSRDIYSIKDKVFVKSIKNDHWRKFYLNLSDRTDYARYFGGYLCREWNERKIQHVKGVQLKKLEIIAFSQQNLINGDKSGITRKHSWRHWCFDKDYELENPKK